MGVPLVKAGRYFVSKSAVAQRYNNALHGHTHRYATLKKTAYNARIQGQLTRQHELLLSVSSFFRRKTKDSHAESSGLAGIDDRHLPTFES
jgi:hypothetical protein